MNVETFEKLIKTDNSARLYFRKKCYKKTRIFCTRCHSTKVYRIAGKKYRCKQCKYTFHDFTDRWINKLRCSLKTWLWLIKLFELEVCALRAAVQCKISYPTALKAYDLIRYSILASAQDAQELLGGEIEIDESYFGGRRKGKRGKTRDSHQLKSTPHGLIKLLTRKSLPSTKLSISHIYCLLPESVEKLRQG